jgi:hypothetical protein
VFFTVWLATHIGVQKVDHGLIRAAQMLGTPQPQMLWEIVFLGALPYITVGLRTAVSISFYTLVAAELAGAFAGIVYRIEIAQQNMQTGQVMGGLAALGLLSFVADRSFAILAERRVVAMTRASSSRPAAQARGCTRLPPRRVRRSSGRDLSIVFDVLSGQVIAVDRVSWRSGEFVSDRRSIRLQVHALNAMVGLERRSKARCS